MKKILKNFKTFQTWFLLENSPLSEIWYLKKYWSILVDTSTYLLTVYTLRKNIHVMFIFIASLRILKLN